MHNETTILYVDDEPINLMLMEVNLKKFYHVITAESGSEGLEKLRSKNEVSVVISDMKMPGMNGIEFIQAARKDFPNIAYFILTGYDINTEISEALKNKLIYRYFRKPFNINEIKQAVKEVVG